MVDHLVVSTSCRRALRQERLVVPVRFCSFRSVVEWRLYSSQVPRSNLVYRLGELDFPNRRSSPAVHCRGAYPGRRRQTRAEHANQQGIQDRLLERTLLHLGVAVWPLLCVVTYDGGLASHLDRRVFLAVQEPDLPGPTQLDVATAVQIWQSTIIPYQKQGIHLLSPAVTSDESKGLPWLAEFMAAVGNSKPDAIALHYYGTDSSAFEAYVTKVHNLYNLPIYITEVASTSTDSASVSKFLTDITAWCDQQSWINGVFWFAASRTANTQENLGASALMSSTGSRTALGNLYCTS